MLSTAINQLSAQHLTVPGKCDRHAQFYSLAIETPWVWGLPPRDQFVFGLVSEHGMGPGKTLVRSSWGSATHWVP